MKRLLELINQYWGSLIILFGIVSTVGTVLWNALVMPQIDAHIDTRVLRMANDSLGLMIDSHLSNKGGGFRGSLADTTGIPKDKIVPALGKIMTREDSILGRIKNLENELDYQRGYNFFLLKQVASKSNYRGVTFWTPPDGNVYYRDMYQYVWDAKYDAYDDCYYYYPNYSNGSRLKCD